ncbi:hypothetical protein LTR95_006528 [Oleoguttula sp. CCFEE 5521]
MHLTTAFGFAIGFLSASTHALRVQHDADSLAAGLVQPTTAFDDPPIPAMRLMRRQRVAFPDVAHPKRAVGLETTTETRTAHSTTTIVPTTTVSVRGPLQHTSGFPPSSSNGTVHLTDKVLSDNTGLPTTTHSSLSFTLTTTRAACVTMAGGCVLCPGDSLDTCPGATFTTPKSVPSGACAAMDSNCEGGEAAVPTTVASIPAPTDKPSSGTSTVLAAGTHPTSTSVSSTLQPMHTTTSTHSSTATHTTTPTTSSTVVQKSEASAMSPKDSAAFSFLDTAVDLEKQLLEWMHPAKLPASSPTATSHLPPFATMSQEIAALSSELKDLAALQSSTSSMIPPAPFPTPESPAPGCHANSNGTMMLMEKPNHDGAQKPAATIDKPVDTNKRIQLIDGKLTDKMGRHGFVNNDNTLQWLEPEGNLALISQFSVSGIENHLALGQTTKWWRCEVGGGQNFVNQPRGDKCPKVWLALIPEGPPPTTTALPPKTAPTHTSITGEPALPPSLPIVPIVAPPPVKTTTSTKSTSSTSSSLLSIKTTTKSTLASGSLTTATAAAALDCRQDGVNGTMKLMAHHGTSIPQTANLTDAGKRFSLHGGVLSDMHGRIAAIQGNRMLVFLRAQDIKFAKWNATFLRCIQAGLLGERKVTGDSISWFSCEDAFEFTYRDNLTNGHECSVIAVQQRSDELSVISGLKLHPLPPLSELDHEDVDTEVVLDDEHTGSSHDLDGDSVVPRDNPTMTLDGKCDVPGGNKTCAGSKFGECCSMEGLCGSGHDFCSENKCTNTYSGPSCGSDPVAIPYWHWYHDSMKQLSTDGTCGLRNVNSSRCRSNSSWNDSQIYTFAESGRCCSVFGYCGMGKDYCERPSCDPTWGQCNDFTWQEASNDPGTVSAAKPKAHPAHSEVGADGVDQVENRETTSNELDVNILLHRDVSLPSIDGTCGLGLGDTTCRSNNKDSDFGDCCSNFGYCGRDEAHCAYRNCQSGGRFGRCDEPTQAELRKDSKVIDFNNVESPCVADQSCDDINAKGRKRQDGDEAVEIVTSTPVTVTAITADSPTDFADPNASDAEANASATDASDLDHDSIPVATTPNAATDSVPTSISAPVSTESDTATDSIVTDVTAIKSPASTPSPSGTGMVVAVTGALTSYVTTLEIVTPSTAAAVSSIENAAGYIAASSSALANTTTSCTSTSTSSRFWPMWDISTVIATGLTRMTGPTSVSVFHAKNTSIAISGTGTVATHITTATGSPFKIESAKPETTGTQKASAEPVPPNAITHAVAAVCGLLACAVFACVL